MRALVIIISLVCLWSQSFAGEYVLAQYPTTKTTYYCSTGSDLITLTVDGEKISVLKYHAPSVIGSYQVVRHHGMKFFVQGDPAFINAPDSIRPPKMIFEMIDVDMIGKVGLKLTWTNDEFKPITLAKDILFCTITK